MNPTPNNDGLVIASERVRGYLYRVVGAATPILTAWGIVAENKAPLYIALAGAILAIPIAAANTSTKG